jgi:hypothetical protein
VVASPSEVKSERDAVSQVVDDLNRGIAPERMLRIELSRWETDVHPGFHPEGPQGLIDKMLRIQDCDVLVGIFWRRFGTPTNDAASGTEHEFRVAYDAWKQSQKPEIMVYFKQRSYKARNSEDTRQWGLVLDLQDNFPKEGLWWPYANTGVFKDLFENIWNRSFVTPCHYTCHLIANQHPAMIFRRAANRFIHSASFKTDIQYRTV